MVLNLAPTKELRTSYLPSLYNHNSKNLPYPKQEFFYDRGTKILG